MEPATIGAVPDLLIDLDLDHEQSAPQHTSLPPAGPARRWMAAALIVALLATMGAAGGRARGGVHLVADVAVLTTATIFDLDGNLYILEPGELIALDPRTAQQRWRVQTGLDREYVTSEGDLIVVTG